MLVLLFENDIKLSWIVGTELGSQTNYMLTSSGFALYI